MPLSSRLRRAGLALTLLATHVAHAQTIRGTVRSRAGDLGVPGAIVLLIDSAATTTYARTLSGDRGEYLLRAPAPGRYALRALRIGFRPTTTAAFDVAGDTTVTLRVTDIPIALRPVTTRERAQCRIRPDSGLLTAALWEQARTALLATAITQDDAAYHLEAEQHSRLFAARGESLRDVRFVDSARAGATTWRSRPPETLRRDGYVTRDGGGIDFVAPDLAVLLSPYFADTHCLRLADRAPAGMIGLDFAPVGRQRHVEIRGTLWLDAHSHELRTLDFRYDNFAYRGVDSLAGGQAHFARLATGAWVMTDWVTRMPIPPRATSGVPNGLSNGVAGDAAAAALARVAITAGEGRWTSDRVRITGGDLRAVTHGGDTLWTRPTGTLRVAIVVGTGARDIPVAEAMVQLVGSDRSVLTDRSGHATFDGLTPGTYLLEATTAELQLLDRVPTLGRAVVVANAVTDSEVRVERSVDVVRELCGAFPLRPGMLVGVVTRDGVPVPDVPILVDDPKTHGRHTQKWGDSLNKLRSYGNGRLRVCKVPINAALEVRTADDSSHVVVQLAPDRLVAGFTLELPPAVRPTASKP